MRLTIICTPSDKTSCKQKHKPCLKWSLFGFIFLAHKRPEIPDDSDQTQHVRAWNMKPQHPSNINSMMHFPHSGLENRVFPNRTEVNTPACILVFKILVISPNNGSSVQTQRAACFLLYSHLRVRDSDLWTVFSLLFCLAWVRGQCCSGALGGEKPMRGSREGCWAASSCSSRWCSSSLIVCHLLAHRCLSLSSLSCGLEKWKLERGM